MPTFRSLYEDNREALRLIWIAGEGSADRALDSPATAGLASADLVGHLNLIHPGRLHVLTLANDLLTMDPATGTQRSWFALNIGSDGVGWAPGEVHAADGFVAVERLRRPVNAEGDDRLYFYNSEPVILAAT